MGRLGRLRLGRRGGSVATEDALMALSRLQYLTPREHFGAAENVYGRVYRSAAGVYLLVAPHLAADDPVHSVGWARNDYWAVQVWGFDGNDFRNDYDADEVATNAPSLDAWGWPHPLSYADTLACATRLCRGRVMVSARYRFSDGRFESHVIQGSSRVRFHYDQPNPAPDDHAVAIELGLGGRRWRQHLAEVRKVNREHSRRG